MYKVQINSPTPPLILNASQATILVHIPNGTKPQIDSYETDREVPVEKHFLVNRYNKRTLYLIIESSMIMHSSRYGRNHNMQMLNIYNNYIIIMKSIVLSIAVAETGMLISSPASADPGDQLFKLIAADGAPDDHFAGSVAVSGDIALIGADQDDVDGTDSGSAYLFNITTGRQIAKLRPDDPAENKRFGYSVAIDGNLAAIGAIGDDTNGRFSGAVYIFDVQTGTQMQKIIPNDGYDNDEFGYTVAINGNSVIVGAPIHADDQIYYSGAAYLYKLGAVSQLVAKFLPNDPINTSFFAASVALNDSVILIGSPNDKGNDFVTGSAYLFDINTGEPIGMIIAGDGAPYDSFGWRVALNHDNALISAWGDDDNGKDSGSAYLFNLSTGRLIWKIYPDDPIPGESLGQSVAISDSTILIASPYDSTFGKDAGSAYLFDINSGTQTTKFFPEDLTEGDRFGAAVAIQNNIIIVASPNDNDNGTNSGSAYLFDPSGSISCLNLTVDNLIAGKNATFTITNGTPGAKSLTVYGQTPGQTSIQYFYNYCATFGINTNQNNIIGGTNRIFDTNGQISFKQPVPQQTAGLTLLFQSAQQGTCPDECTTNLVEMTVQ